MKRRILMVLLLVIVGGLLWYWLPRPEKPILSPQLLVAKSSQSASVSTTAAPEAMPPVSAEQITAKKTTFLRGMAKAGNRPIRFYGLVVDQAGQGIQGVKVTLEIRATKEPVPGVIGDAFDYPVTSTDERGRFTLTDAQGALLTVKSLEKEGYEPSRHGLSQAYWFWRSPELDFHPNEEKPEVFRMWKIAGAERLVRKGVSASLRLDGVPSTFDLTEGVVSEDGDIRVTLERSPREIPPGQKHFQWTVSIEALHGGLIVSDDEQMYLAPEEGYQTKIVLQTPADAAQWTDEKSVNLYAKIHNGKQYARLEIKVLAGSRRATTPFYITSFINPSGSRNLEYDPLLNNSRAADKNSGNH